MPRFDPPFVKSFNTNGDPGNQPSAAAETHHYSISLQTGTVAQIEEFGPAGTLATGVPSLAKPKEWIPIAIMTHTGTGQGSAKDQKKSDWIQLESATLEGQGAGKGAGKGILAHEISPVPGGAGTTRSFTMRGLARQGGASMPFDVYMRGNKGQRVTLRNKQGSAILEGMLESVERVGFGGSDWEITLSDVVTR